MDSKETVLLRTKCKCEKTVSIDRGSRDYLIPIPVEASSRSPLSLSHLQTGYKVRRFEFLGNRLLDGTRVLLEE
jgi:hypothetical protein